MNATKMLTLVIASLTVSAAAEAASTAPEICVRYRHNFTDAANGDLYTNNNTPQRAYGIRIVVVRSSPVAVLYNDYVRASSGCIRLPMDTTLNYTLYAMSEARVSSGQVVRYLTPNNGRYTRVWTFRPPANSARQNFDWNSVGSTDATSSVLAAATRVVKFRRGDVGSFTWDLYAQQNSECEASCYLSSTPFFSGAIYLDDVGRRRKFTIAHELGHMIQDLHGGIAADFDCNFTAAGYPAACASDPGNVHGLNSLEFQSCAAVEGFADFVAAIAWNYTSQATFAYRGTISSSGLNQYATCMPLPGLVRAGYGVESDWMRTLWGTMQEWGTSYRDLYKMMGGLGGNRATTFWSAQAASLSWGVPMFRYEAKINGIYQ